MALDNKNQKSPDELPDKYYAKLEFKMKDRTYTFVHFKSIYVVRNIIEYEAPYLMFTVELDLTFIALIEELLVKDSHNFPSTHFKLIVTNKATNISAQEFDMPSSDENKLTVYDNDIVITKCIREEVATIKPTILVTLVAIQHTFFSMQKKFLFAAEKAIFNNKKAADVLEKDFLKFINTEYGTASGDFFKLKSYKPKVNKYDTINNFVYESIYMDGNIPDMFIPSYIIQKYKPFNMHYFCFYDDFYFDYSKSSKDVPFAFFYLINFLDAPNTFKKIEIDKIKDVVDNSSILSKESISDTKGYFKKFEDLSITMRKSAMKWNKDKREGKKTKIQKLQQSIKNEKKVPAGKIAESDSKRMNEETKNKIVVPVTVDVMDDGSSLKSQIDLTYHYINNCMKEIFLYEFPRCMPHHFSFGCIYNLEGYNPNPKKEENMYYTEGLNQKYTLTPIAIVNAFHISGEKAFYMEHSTYVQMLKVETGKI